ncbi:unnamed protein product, partial [Mesorhabditis belari]|uniref:Peroxisomal multifunctional enzyme type 2 n=1 Tax=Mesorhabditis belari TaxID=2138241 RepID=A0AAF3EXT0_9BILA
MDPAKARAHKAEPEFFEYNQRDTIVYALGIGARAKEDIRYLYEGAEDFTVFPTYVVAPGLMGSGVAGWPGIDFDLTRILHGEQYIEIFKPLPTDAKLRSERQVIDILDKGKGALILSNITTFNDRNGEKLSLQQFGTFQVGSGGFGGNRSSPHEFAPAAIPQRNPDKVIEQKTTIDQAALYRMGSGDLNPLHIDPMFAKMSGFKEPILHGLCTLGFSTRHVVEAFADNDANKLRAVKVRFSSPVLPGQTLQTEMWREGDRVIFQTKVKETGKVVIANAWAKLDGLDGKAPSTNQSNSSGMTLKSAALFDQIKAELPNHKEKVKQVKGIILYELTAGGKVIGKYTIDLKNGDGDVYEGDAKEKASVTVTVDDEDFVKIAAGELEPTKAFMTGKLKAKGNIMMLQKLQGILQNAQKSKL